MFYQHCYLTIKMHLINHNVENKITKKQLTNTNSIFLLTCFPLLWCAVYPRCHSCLYSHVLDCLRSRELYAQYSLPALACLDQDVQVPIKADIKYHIVITPVEKTVSVFLFSLCRRVKTEYLTSVVEDYATEIISAIVSSIIKVYHSKAISISGLLQHYPLRPPLNRIQSAQSLLSTSIDERSNSKHVCY